jgi:hypothetical protein
MKSTTFLITAMLVVLLLTLILLALLLVVPAKADDVKPGYWDHYFNRLGMHFEDLNTMTGSMDGFPFWPPDRICSGVYSPENTMKCVKMHQPEYDNSKLLWGKVSVIGRKSCMMLANKARADWVYPRLEKCLSDVNGFEHENDKPN